MATQPLFDMSQARPIQGAPMFDMSKAQPIQQAAQPHPTGGAGGSWDQLSVQPSDARTIPNPRIRNLQNPVDPSWGPGRSLYEGAKTGAELGSIPGSVYATLPQLIKGAVGGAAGGYAGSKGAEMLGAGEFGQEVAGDVGGLAGGGLANIDSPNLGPKVKALGKLGAQEAISHIPVAGHVVRRPSIMDYINAARTKAAVPETAPTQVDVYSPGYRTPQAHYAGPPPAPIPQRQGLQLGGEVQQPLEGEYVPSLREQMQAEPPYAPATEVQPQAEGPLPAPYRQVGAGIIQDDLSAPSINWTAGKIPQRSGLMLPGEAPNTSPQTFERLINQGTGGRELKPNVPLKEQIRSSSPQSSLPKDFTPVQSSALKGYKYDPIKHEFESITKTGDHYIHGDVSPEQVEAFEKADSKGKAWSALKNNSTLVAKVVNGRRMATKPPIGMRSADPNDLTPILKESLKQAVQKKSAGP